jgi:hypothetical protein
MLIITCVGPNTTCHIVGMHVRTYMLIITCGAGTNTTGRVVDMHVHVQTYMLIITCLWTQHDMSCCWHAVLDPTRHVVLLTCMYEHPYIRCGVGPSTACRVVDMHLHVQTYMLIITCVSVPTRHANNTISHGQSNYVHYVMQMFAPNTTCGIAVVRVVCRRIAVVRVVGRVQSYCGRASTDRQYMLG